MIKKCKRDKGRNEFFDFRSGCHTTETYANFYVLVDNCKEDLKGFCQSCFDWMDKTKKAIPIEVILLHQGQSPRLNSSNRPIWYDNKQH